MKNMRLFVYAAIAVTLVLACTTASAAAASTISINSTPKLGAFLVNESGMTLYYLAADVPGNGMSNCNSSECPSHWTPFNASSVNVSPPLTASNFSTITTSSGKQTTYRGWPLYTYNGDTKPGQTNGDGFKGVWFVEKPNYSVTVMENSTVGRYLADGTGRPVYNFTLDTAGTSKCTGGCPTVWPPFNAQPVVAPSALNTSDFSTITGAGSNTQTTYKGMPLYYFISDPKAGELSGNHFYQFGGYWYLVPPNATGYS